MFPEVHLESLPCLEKVLNFKQRSFLFKRDLKQIRLTPGIAMNISIITPGWLILEGRILCDSTSACLPLESTIGLFIYFSIMKTLIISICLLSAIFCIPSQLKADIIEVPADQATIELAISAASSGDTILIAPGIYFEHLEWSDKNIVLGSWYLTTGDTSYIGQTIINGGANGRIMKITYVEGVSALSGLTLTNGKSTEGAAIYLLSSKIRMKHLRIKGNLTSGTEKAQGAAILAYNTKIFADEIVIDSNRAICANDNSFGAGIYGRNSELYITNSRISNNTADLGGGIFQVYGLIDVNNVRFENNTAGYPGGAIALFANAKLNATNSVFTGNNGAGSALYGSETQALSFVNCMFTNNGSTVIDVRKLVLRLNNCTFTNNSGAHAVWAFSNTVLHAMNTVFWNDHDHELNLSGNTNQAFIGYCALTNGEDGIKGDGPYTIFGPLWDMDPLLMEENDYKLSDYSPYIGAGLDSLEVFPFMKAPLFDMENNPRPLPDGSMPDLGAYEHLLGGPLMGSEESKTAKIRIFPNPVEDHFFIDNRSGYEIYKVKVFDARGILLMEVEPEQIQNKIQIDAKGKNTKGLLFIEVTGENGVFSKKLLVL